jgi:hypothetical protein
MIRNETLRALEYHVKVADTKIVNALINEVQHHEYTTARTAARILGMKEAHSAIAVLRNALKSEDYLLCAESMIALARLRDKQSIRKIELITKITPNPLLVIFGAEALRIYGSMDSLSVLMEILERPNLAHDLQNQIILSISGALNMDAWFYPFFSAYEENPRNAILHLCDAPARRKSGASGKSAEINALREKLHSVWNDAPASRSIVEKMIELASFPAQKKDFLHGIFLGAIKNEKLNKPEIHFLLAAICLRYESLESN